MSLGLRGNGAAGWPGSTPPKGEPLPWAGTRGQAFAWQGHPPRPAGRLTATVRRVRAGKGNAPRFPRPQRGVSAGPFVSLTSKGRRLPRWARERPPWAGRALADGLWAIEGDKGPRHRMAGATASANRTDRVSPTIPSRAAPRSLPARASTAPCPVWSPKSRRWPSRSARRRPGPSPRPGPPRSRR